ncbi:energy transducer TonB [Paraglaciecola sp.]|uniref:energy transducer TonB n=1 Tax=Paraglaciecola sp. TaxID=1920173 RepID=UPI003EF55DE0
MKHLSIALILCSFIPTTHAEQTEVSRLIETAIIKDAKPLERIHPRYPVTAARKGQEGWVKLSFVINKEGEVVEPIIEDSSGIKGFEKSAIRAIKQWKYDPAEQDGKVIEQCKSTVQLDFRLQGSLGVTSTFYRHYKKISAAIAKKDYQLAEQNLQKLKTKKLWNMHENDWFWLADSLLAFALKDPIRELNSVNRASNGAEKSIGKDNYLHILSRMFILQVEQQIYVQALATFEKIEKVKGAEKLVKQYTPVIQQINAAITSDKTLVRNTQINQRGHQTHQLSRNRFQISDVQGPLRELEIRCDNKRSRFTAEEDSIWNIPASWGQCNVFFKGEENTKFNIIELANKV